MVQSNEDLLRLAVRGDQSALAALLEHIGPVVRERMARQIGTRWQSLLSVDDVMQQAYTDAFLSIETVSDEHVDGFERWLMTLARRNLLAAIRMLRARKRGGNRDLVSLFAGEDSYAALYESLSASDATPSRIVARDEAVRCLQEALRHLPEPYRQVIELYDLRGQPVDRVAEALDRSIGAVFMLRARAHERLAEVLGSASKYFSAES